MRRIAIALIILALSIPLTAVPVLAVAPDNDTYSGRTIIAGLPFADSLETSEATTDDDDIEINAGCAPATDASVWYELTLDADQGVLIDVTGADYTAGVIVATGSPGSFSQVACGPEFVAFDAVAGETYAILVFDDQLDGGGSGGMLTIEADEPPPPPTVELVIDPEGTINPLSESAMVTGTVACSEPAFADISLSVQQHIGVHIVLGDGFTAVDCGPDGTDFSVEVFGFTSFFNPGTVTVLAEAFACTFDCGFASAEVQVRLRPAPEQPPEPAPAPANDERDGALSIGLDATAEQSTVDATAGPDDPVDCIWEPVPPSGHTVWYAFTAPADGFFEVNTIGSDYDTTVFVLGPDGTVVACDDDIVAGEDQDSLAIFDGVAGETYLIMAGSFADEFAGQLMLTVTTSEVGPPPPPEPPDVEVPANDERASAIALAVGDSIGPVDTSGATSAPDDPFPSCAPTSHTVWYTVTADESSWIEVNTAGSDYDTLVVVLADGNEVACNDDFQSVESRAVWFAEAGVTYEVMVGSFAESPGGMLMLTVQVTDAPLAVEIAPEDLRAWVDPRSGVATVHGIVTCSEEASVDLLAFLNQQKGRFTVVGESGHVIDACSPDGTEFELTFAGNGAFRPGDADLFIEAFAFNESEDAFAFFGEIVNLAPVSTRR